MKDVNAIKEKFIAIFQKYKSYIIAIGVCSLVVIILLLNIGAIQVGYYRATNNKNNLINVLSHEMKKDSNQKKAYFKWGVDSLLKDLSEESRIFFEDNFEVLHSDIQEDVIMAYNKNNLFFKNPKGLIHVVAKGNTEAYIKEYINRVPIEDLEVGLEAYFGEKKEITIEKIQELYNVLSVYSTRLPLNKFKLNIYSILEQWSKDENKEPVEKLLGHIDSQALRRELINTLKTQPIEISKLNTWVELLNKSQVFTTKEYANFTSSYNEILQLKEQLKQLKVKEVDIQNIKATAEVEIEKINVKVNEKKNEINVQNEKKKTLQLELDKLKNYETRAFYILDYYGENEYEAATPKKSMFFDSYKPSNEKMIIKVGGTKITEPGVINLDVYNQGNKLVGNTGKSLPYFVEVSDENKTKIANLKSEMMTYENIIGSIQKEIDKYQQEIRAIKKQTKYDENMALLGEVRKGQGDIAIKIREKQVQIQALLGIGNVVINQ